MKALNLKGTIFENAKVVRAVQYVSETKKTEENLIYSVELELNKVPVIVTMRIGSDFTEMSIVDKKTGKMLEYLAEQKGKVEFIKAHGLSPEQVKKLFSAKQSKS